MGAIIRANADMAVPLGYFTRAAKANPSFWGVAWLEDGKLKYEIAGEAPSAENLAENQQILKSSTCLIHLGSAPDGFPPEIQQPFVLLGEPESPLLVALLDGDFKSYEDKKGKPGWSGEALCVEGYLKPKIAKLYKLCGNDLAKLIEQMQEDDFATDMDRSSGVHGSIVILAQSGECLEFVKNDNAKEYDWGWTSQSYDWQDEAEKAVSDAAKATNKDKLSAAVAAKNAVNNGSNVVTLSAVPGGNKGEVKAVPGPNEPPAGRDASNSVLLRCPKSITKRKTMERWYKVFAGFCPHDYEKRPQVWVPKAMAQKATSGRVDDSIKSLQDLGANATVADLAGTAVPAPDSDTGTDDDQVVDGNDAADGSAGEGDQGGGALHEQIPMIEASEIGKFKKWNGSTAYRALKDMYIADPTKFQDLESKVPDFAKSLGMKGDEEVYQLTYAMWYYIVCNWPQIGAAGGWHFIQRTQDLESQIEVLEAKVASLSAPPTAMGTQPTAQGTPAPVQPANGTGKPTQKPAGRLVKRAQLPG